MNTNNVIDDLLKLKKNESFDYVKEIDFEIIGKTMCAFLNGIGGQFLIGKDENNQIFGVENPDKKEKDLVSFLLDTIKPDAPISISVDKYENKSLLLLKVWPGNKQPYIFDGTIYYRQYDSTIRATSQQVSDLIHKRSENEVHWERQPSIGVEYEDLDIHEIQKTMQAALESNKVKGRFDDPLDFLSYYGLYQNGYFTNAAVVLFAENPSKFIPQVRSRVSLLLDGKTADTFDDDKLLEGNLFQNLKSINDFFDKHLSITRKFKDNDWKRKDEHLYPIPALREGVMNA